MLVASDHCRWTTYVECTYCELYIQAVQEEGPLNTAKQQWRTKGRGGNSLLYHLIHIIDCTFLQAYKF
jgi:hypothetical protein